MYRGKCKTGEGGDLHHRHLEDKLLLVIQYFYCMMHQFLIETTSITYLGIDFVINIKKKH